MKRSNASLWWKNQWTHGVTALPGQPGQPGRFHGTFQHGNAVKKTMFLMLSVSNPLQFCHFRWISVVVPWEWKDEGSDQGLDQGGLEFLENSEVKFRHAIGTPYYVQDIRLDGVCTRARGGNPISIVGCMDFPTF